MRLFYQQEQIIQFELTFKTDKTLALKQSKNQTFSVSK
jgi:hypothetical protein